MKRKPKSLGKNGAQLEGALALFGGNIRVAGYDQAAFTHRTGELIAHTAAKGKPAPPKSRKQEEEQS